MGPLSWTASTMDLSPHLYQELATRYLLPTSRHTTQVLHNKSVVE
jgi:hypothetical protein